VWWQNGNLGIKQHRSSKEAALEILEPAPAKHCILCCAVTAKRKYEGKSEMKVGEQTHGIPEELKLCYPE
jgi:hypothetical protein